MMFKPWPYQDYCINRILSDEALGLFLDMGLGKTVITLTAINILRYHRFAIGKTLVIAPKRVAEDTWTRETGKWDHLQLLKVLPVLGGERKRINALATPADVYVINRENVQWLVDYYKNAWPFEVVVIDELSSFKNWQSKRFKALKAIRPRIKRIIGLTGTPAPNGLMDLWAQVYLLDSGKRLGCNISEYRRNYFLPDKRNAQQIYSYKPAGGSDDIINRQISDICISLRAEDYLSLPEKVIDTHYVKLDSKAKKRYGQMERDLLLRIDEDTIDAQSAVALSNKLLQICNGAVYDSDRKVIGVHNCKIEPYLELIEAANGAPVLTFYNFQHDRDRIIKALVKYKLRVGELKSPEDITRWNNKELDVLLAHPASAAYGLNLQDGGNQIIWFGLNWSLELYQQANARLHRQGQKQSVIIHHLVVEDSRDTDVLAALEDKNNSQEALLNSLKARIKRIKEGKAS